MKPSLLARTPRLALIAAAFAVAGTLALPPAVASAAAASEMMGTVLGKTTNEVSAKLKSMGYEVRRFENEDGMIEGYAIKDGKRYEVYVNPADGKVARFKAAD
jgi:hypothetical protein